MGSYSKFAFIALLAICMGGMAATNANAEHPFHVSLTEIELNPETNCFEIAIGMWPADIERTLSDQTDQVIDFDKIAEEQRDRLLEGYINQRFKISDAKGQSGKINWVGHEFDPKAVWVFFEVPADKTPLNWSIENRILFELNEAQLNQHSIKIGEKRISISATIDSGKHPLIKPKN